MQEKAFEYGGYHFIPFRKFEIRDGDFYEVCSRLRTDKELGMFAADYHNGQKHRYSYEDF